MALAVMHVLSSFMGFALPALLPKMYTHYASIILFLYFGYKLLQDAYDSKGEGPSEELHVCLVYLYLSQSFSVNCDVAVDDRIGPYLIIMPNCVGS